MIIVGAHYMPFIFLYGMREYAVLAAALMGGGITLGILMPDQFNVGGWLGGAALVIFGVVAGRLAQRARSVAAL
jgi:hypothetical protein